MIDIIESVTPEDIAYTLEPSMVYNEVGIIVPSDWEYGVFVDYLKLGVIQKNAEDKWYPNVEGMDENFFDTPQEATNFFLKDYEPYYHSLSMDAAIGDLDCHEV